MTGKLNRSRLVQPINHVFNFLYCFILYFSNYNTWILVGQVTITSLEKDHFGTLKISLHLMWKTKLKLKLKLGDTCRFYNVFRY